jgi:hypothetical protein
MRPFIKVSAETILHKIGQDMYDIISRAVFNKTFKVSLMSNHDVSGSGLVKLMQVDL